ncbi:MAG TPA: hypothetical protein EYP17_05340 [Candidatus Latescibacteria bacterium]|nr:hypothetical protein [Candidatus Latescibacterota bacterium]
MPIMERPVLVAGGTGAVPLKFLAERAGEPLVILGGRTGEELLFQEEFERLGETILATEDGSAGVRGTVVDALRQVALRRDLEGAAFYNSGPEPMMAAAVTLQDRIVVCVYTSCGVGLCGKCALRWIPHLCGWAVFPPFLPARGDRIREVSPGSIGAAGTRAVRGLRGTVIYQALEDPDIKLRVTQAFSSGQAETHRYGTYSPWPSPHIRVNLGGGEYVDSDGEVWHADRAYIPGSWGCTNLPQTDVLTTDDPISGTQDVELFRSVRMGEEVVYRFDVPDGEYEVRILFAEIYWESSSAEQQDVYIQGRRVLRAFNIFDEAGHDVALEKRFKARATGDGLEVRFVGRSLPMHSGARACAIEIRPLSK